jgi:biopolymer transport protein ExbB/TolQ
MMKQTSLLKLVGIVSMAVMLNGCAAVYFAKDKIANFYMSRWDANEAALVSKVTVQSVDVLQVCDPKTAKEQQVTAIGQLHRTSTELLAYSRTLPDDNSPVITVVKNINDATDEFYKRSQDKMSKLYCENKATNIKTMSEQAQRVVQAKRK